MDSLDVLRKFPDLCPQPEVTEEDNKLRIKLLAVFGNEGEEVIAITADDRVYSFGANHFGRLGLGVKGLIARPQLNATLTGKKIMKICYGLGHCLGLTSGGQCYGWGHNSCGQLGIGSVEDVSTPQPIKILSNTLQHKEMEDISCGDNHSLVLTKDGMIYSFGANDRRQCGHKEGEMVWRPFRVKFEAKFIAISCGHNHSSGLTDTGTAYVWGSNDSQQLGPEAVVVAGQTYCYPHPINGKKRLACRTVICGPNHTIVKTVVEVAKGSASVVHVYGNYDWKPDRNNAHEFDTCLAKQNYNKIDTTYDNRVVIATKWDRQLKRLNQFILGKHNGSEICIPIDIPIGCSLFDVCAKYCGYNRTFESIVDSIETSISLMESCSQSDEEIYWSEGEEDNDLVTEAIGSHVECKSTGCCERNVNGFQNYLLKPFDNRLDSDLRFIVENQYIYCHKTVLKIRNKEFWRICEQNMINESEIEINAYSYDTIKAFLKFLYGLRPEVNDQNCRQLLGLAEEYGERGLEDICQIWKSL